MRPSPARRSLSRTTGNLPRNELRVAGRLFPCPGGGQAARGGAGRSVVRRTVRRAHRRVPAGSRSARQPTMVGASAKLGSICSTPDISIRFLNLHRARRPAAPLRLGLRQNRPVEALEINAGAVHLRAPRSEDVDAITAVCQDPEIQRWTRLPSPYGREDAVFFVEQVARSGWE